MYKFINNNMNILLFIIIGSFIGVITGMSSILGIIVIVLLSGTVLLWKRSQISIYILLFLLPLHGLLIYLIRIPILSYWKELLLISSISIIFIKCMLLKKRFFSINKIDVIVIIYDMYFISMFLLRGEKEISSIGLMVYILYTMLYFYTRILDKEQDILNKSIHILIIVGIIVSIGGILQSTTKLDIFMLGSEEAYRFGMPRASFSLGSSIVFGAFVALIGNIVFAKILIENKNYRKKIIWIVLLIMILIATLLSFARAAWIQFIVGAIVTIYLYNGNKKNNFSNIILFIFIIIILINILDTGIYDFIKTGVSDRDSIWKMGIDLFKENLIVGNGLGSTLWATREIRGSNFVVESNIIQFMVESGIVGIALFGTIVILSIIKCKKIIYTKSNDDKWIYISIISVIVSIIVSMTVAQSFNSWVINMIFWYFISVVSSR